MQGAIILRSAQVVPGREGALVDLTRDTHAFFDKARTDGRITDYMWFTSGQGNRGDYVILRGDTEKLVAFAADPEFQTLSMRSSLILPDFEWGFYGTGDPEEVLERYQEMARQLS